MSNSPTQFCISECFYGVARFLGATNTAFSFEFCISEEKQENSLRVGFMFIQLMGCLRFRVSSQIGDFASTLRPPAAFILLREIQPYPRSRGKKNRPYMSGIMGFIDIPSKWRSTVVCGSRGPAAKCTTAQFFSCFCFVLFSSKPQKFRKGLRNK